MRNSFTIIRYFNHFLALQYFVMLCISYQKESKATLILFLLIFMFNYQC